MFVVRAKRARRFCARIAQYSRTLRISFMLIIRPRRCGTPSSSPFRVLPSNFKVYMEGRFNFFSRSTAESTVVSAIGVMILHSYYRYEGTLQQLAWRLLRGLDRLGNPPPPLPTAGVRKTLISCTQPERLLVSSMCKGCGFPSIFPQWEGARDAVRRGCRCNQQAADDNEGGVVPRPLVLRLLVI